METQTLTTDPNELPDSERLRVPGLTIVAHPKSHRIGEVVALPELASGRTVKLSRLEPTFLQPETDFRPTGNAARPLGDSHLSRQPWVLSAGPAPGSIALERTGSPTRLRVRGETIADRHIFDDAELQRGVTLVMGQQIALHLHLVDPLGHDASPTLGLVGASEAMAILREEIRAAARLEDPVLLRGETGTGKELVARALHENSPRQKRPFQVVNIGALVPTLAASELFGAVRGAYTGADRAKVGFFRSCDGGTLFLDEIGEANPEVQATLLRTLETGEVQPVGSIESVKIDVRVLAATDADLERAMSESRFRPALLHRLEGFEIRLPPLRERRDDVPRLLRYFFEQEIGKVSSDEREAETREIPWPSAEAVAKLVDFDWPGNVRQLRNVARRLLVAGLHRGRAAQDRLVDELAPQREPADTQEPAGQETGGTIQDLLRHSRKPLEIDEAELLAALEAHQWAIKPTAEALRISRGALYRRIENSPELRKATDLDASEIAASLDRHGGDVPAAALELRVSPQGLRRRLSAEPSDV